MARFRLSVARGALFSIVIPFAVAGGLAGCKRAPPSLAAPAVEAVAVPIPASETAVAGPIAVEAAAIEPLATPYPPGRWRLAPPAALQGHVLWVSHILIRHRDVTPDAISFNATQWAPPHPVPARTRQEAFELVRALAERAARDPGRFPELAREASEDPVTRARSGSLGGVEAGQLFAWPEVLDALAALRDGEVSRPVETEFGVHVFMRRQPPKEATVSGASIVIGYDGVRWLHHFLARRPIPPRSHAEASALAAEVALEARRSPEAFARLVERYSDHQDAARGGDFGAWSTREPTHMPIIIELLQNLEIGQVADPIDTPFGFQIILRTAPRQRQRFAMESIQLQVDPSLPDAAPGSLAFASKQLRDIGETLTRFPTRFAHFQSLHCCQGREQWEEGRGSPGAEVALRRGAGPAWEPIALERTMLALVKGVPADAQPPPMAMYLGLPEPPAADLEYFFTSFDASPVLAQCPAVASQRLGSSGEELARLETLHAAAARSLTDGSGAPRAQVLGTLLGDVQGLLGPERFRIYVQVLEELVRQRLLAPEIAGRISRTLAVALER
jgi:hypothetical protein